MAVDDDMCSDGMQCTDHPYRTTSPSGGICAFCLQDKLGKLVSTSSSSFLFNNSSSSSPSFRSDLPSSAATTSLSISIPTASNTILANTTNSRNHNHHHHYNQHRHNNTINHLQKDHSTTTSRPRIPFLLTQKKKKKALGLVPPSDDVQSSSYSTNNSVLKRSKSSATPRSARFLEDFSPRRRGFWSFLHISNTHHKKPTTIVTPSATTTAPPENTTAAVTSAAVVVMDETDESPNSSGGASNTASFGRKVSRSRSVGCGSRSFSGDFFERISTGFGDCTLRRVESHREGSKHRHSTSRAAGDTVREKVRCGGLFGGLIVTSSSSSTTSSSSSYWGAGDGRPNGPTVTPAGPLVHGRSRSWGWAFASPMRAFAKPTTTRYDSRGEPGGGGDGDGSIKINNGTPNLAAIPSLLSIRG